MKRLFSGIALFSVLLLASCGGEKAAKDGGAVIFGGENFNGVFTTGWGNSSVDAAVRDLVNGWGFLLTKDEGGQIHLNFMVESREVSEDSLTNVFKLKKGIMFHNGEELKAEDVVFTFEVYMDTDAMVESSGNANMAEYIKSVKAIDDYTVEVVLKEKFYATDASVLGGDENILNKKEVLKDKPADLTVQQHIKNNLLSTPVGLGPYKFVEYVENQWVKLVRFEDFKGNFRNIKPSIQDIVLKVVADETESDELLTENIDILAGVVMEDRIDAAKATDHIAYNNYPRHGYGHLTFHTDFGPVADVRVRQAFGFMMDRQKFVNVFLGSYGSSTQGPYSTNYWMIDDEWIAENLTTYVPNLEKTESLLKDAGYTRNGDGWFEKDGEVLEIKIAAPAQSWADALNLVLSEKTQAEFGFKVTIQTVDFSVLLSHYYGSGSDGVTKDDRAYHAFALATTLTPVFDGYANWHSDNIEEWGVAQSNTSSRYNNPVADELLLNMRSASSDEIFQENYLNWIKETNRDLPILPLYSNDYHDLYNVKIKNFTSSAIWKWQHAIIEANL